MTWVPPSLENLKEAKVSWRQTGQPLYCQSGRKDTPEGLGMCLVPPPPSSYFLRGNQEQWIGGHNGSEDATPEICFICHFPLFVLSAISCSVHHVLISWNETLCLSLGVIRRVMRGRLSFLLRQVKKGKTREFRQLSPWSHIREKELRYVVSDCKVWAYKAGDLSLIPESGRSLWEENDDPLQYSCLKNPMNRGAWWATVHSVAKSRIWLSD